MCFNDILKSIERIGYINALILALIAILLLIGIIIYARANKKSKAYENILTRTACGQTGMLSQTEVRDQVNARGDACRRNQIETGEHEIAVYPQNSEEGSTEEELTDRAGIESVVSSTNAKTLGSQGEKRRYANLGHSGKIYSRAELEEQIQE